MQNARRNPWAIIGIAVSVKLLYLLYTFALANSGVTFTDSKEFTAGSINQHDSLTDIFFRYDAGWYEKIATEGHHKISPDSLAPTSPAHWFQSYYAFFPLYPATVKGVQLVTGLGYKPAAILFSFIISIVAFLVFYHFVKLFTQSEKTAFTATVVLILFPFNFFFSMALTEAYFLALLVGAFIGVHKKNIALMLICCGLMVLVRPNGIAMALPLGLYYIERHVFLGTWRWPKAADFTALLPGLALLIMPVVFFAYCFYLKEMTGDFFAFSTAQKGWGKAYANPVKVLLKPRGWRWAIESGYAIGVMALAFFNRKKIPVSMHVLIGLSLFLPLWAGKTISLPRYLSVVFPIFILVGIWLENRPRLKPYLYLTLAVVHLISFYFWLLPDMLAC